MDHTCHHHMSNNSLPNNELFTLTGLIEIDLIITLFLIGLANSFTHCIGMCGPIAMGQASLRLMNITPNQMNEKSRLKASLALPYYLGKALTYSLLASFISLFSNMVTDNETVKIIKLIIMSITVIIFVIMTLDSLTIKLNTALIKQSLLKVMKPYNDLILKLVNNFNFNPIGKQGLVLGMMLGLIPCGLVYANILTAVNLTNNFILAGLAMFAFGLGTFPGLFIVSYSGQHIMLRWRKFFKIFYITTMIINIILLSKYSYRIWLSL